MGWGVAPWGTTMSRGSTPTPSPQGGGEEAVATSNLNLTPMGAPLWSPHWRMRHADRSTTRVARTQQTVLGGPSMPFRLADASDLRAAPTFDGDTHFRLCAVCRAAAMATRHWQAKSLPSFGRHCGGQPRALQYSTSPRSRTTFLNRSVLRTAA
jgi:hypothetical protein